MEKLTSSFKNMALTLTAISVVAAAALSGVYMLTKERIEVATALKSEKAIKEVLPDFDKIEEVITPNGTVLYKAYSAEGEFIGAAVETTSSKGYEGAIKIMVGFDKEGNIVNYAVLSQKETPGLGNKIINWFKTDKGNQCIIGKNPAKNNLTVSKDGGEIDAITASTISSRAFLDAVNKGYAAYFAADDTKTDAETGATKTEAKAEAEVKAEAEDVKIDTKTEVKANTKTDTKTTDTKTTIKTGTKEPDATTSATTDAETGATKTDGGQ